MYYNKYMLGGILTISEMSEISGISAYTLRYYESIGLIKNIARDNNNLRVYNQEDIDKIKYITCMRHAGMSVKSLKKYLEYYDMTQDTSEECMDILVEEKQKLLNKLTDLNEAIDLMNYKIDNYQKIIKNKEKNVFRKNR